MLKIPCQNGRDPSDFSPSASKVAALASFTVLEDLSANLKTPQMKHAAGTVTKILERACDRIQACKFPLEDQHPGSIMNLMLDEALKGLSYSDLTRHQLNLRLHFVGILVENLTGVLRVLPQEWNLPSGEQRMAATLDEGSVFDQQALNAQYESYRSWVQHAQRCPGLQRGLADSRGDVDRRKGRLVLAWQHEIAEGAQ